MHPGGTVLQLKYTLEELYLHLKGSWKDTRFYDIISLSLNLDCIAKIGDYLLCPILDLSLLSLISLPFIPFYLALDQIVAFMLILEEKSLNIDCPLSAGIII